MARQNDIDLIYVISKGLKHKECDGISKFTKPNYKVMKRISELISYENWVVIDREKLCEHLGCTNKNLYLKLDPLIKYHLIEFESPRSNSRLDTGQVKIKVNPRYFYGYSMRKTREQAVSEWYLFTEYGSDCKGDITLSPTFQKVWEELKQ